MKEKRVLAFDFGASSGRAMLGIYDGSRIRLEEIHRFSNDPVFVGGTMYWDVLRLFHEIKQGLIKARLAGGFDSVGIDTWGVDFGLIDDKGYLLENPVHYRDGRTAGMQEKSFEKISREEFYRITGCQFMDFNTAFQVLSLAENRPELLERADRLLLVPDLFNYLLTGKKTAEYSMVSTTQLMDAAAGQWSGRVIDALGLPAKLFADIIPGGTDLGPISEDICRELELDPVHVISVAGHDTQSAMISVPAKEEDFIFVSCGTWSLLGTELDHPLIDENSEKYNITNEGFSVISKSGTIEKAAFLKNIIGLWLIQESRRQWIREGKEYGFGELEKMGAEAEPFRCFIDPDDPVFMPAGNIPQRIREYCRNTSQYVPETEGEIVRCINQSLAMKYRNTMEQISACTGRRYNAVYMVGGGTQSGQLCRMTASACGCPVSAGPVEATVLGNIVTQLMAAGLVDSLLKARELIAKSPDIHRYEPVDAEKWNKAYQKFLEVTGC